ncbi:hypothetical protein AgCh_039414 [Apium graveolens]
MDHHIWSCSARTISKKSDKEGHVTKLKVGAKISVLDDIKVEDDGREIPMKKNSAKIEVILKEKCLCYNEDSSHPRVIRLGHGLEKNHFSALRTAIYQIGSQDEEL